MLWDRRGLLELNWLSGSTGWKINWDRLFLAQGEEGMGHTLELVRFPDDDVQGTVPSLRTLHKIEENVLFPLGARNLGNNPLPPEVTSVF